ncbi:MAG TPA: DUF3306 domain-containing protein [Pseudolabrys sp.]|nr:DUF3306 domain-containing protein [Pseudolabrys sp.]
MTSSGRDEEKPFLERWSQRKREAERERTAPVPDAKKIDPAPSAEIVSTQTEFDVTTLPPIDSIGPQTDIRDFLRPGVPTELARAALRRVWSSDPAIRDFVGLSENAWDFNDPTAMPGFGPLEPGQAERLLAHLMRNPAEAADPAAARDPPAEASGMTVQSAADEPAALADPDETSGAMSQSANNPAATVFVSSDTASQHGEPSPQGDAAHARRAHGRALPE